MAIISESLFLNPFDILFVSSCWGESYEIEVWLMLETCLKNDRFKHFNSFVSCGHDKFEVTILNLHFISSNKSSDDTFTDGLDIGDQVIVPKDWDEI